MTFETWLESSRLRPYFREHYEVKPLRAATDVGTIPHALYFPCGNGSSTSLVLKHFSIERMSAVDRDEGLIAAARANSAPAGVDFSVADLRSLAFADATFDAVFDLADLHNYSEWERSLAEIRRVLKPGGLLLLEELSRESFSSGAGRFFRLVTEHPYESMLTVGGFRDCVLRNGFEILHFEERNQFRLLRYLIMVARKT